MEPDELLRYVVQVCARLKLPYLVTGSIATIAYGEPRFTNDIDIVLGIPVSQVDDFCQSFPESEFYLSRAAVVAAIQHQSQFNLIHPESGLKVDFMIPAPTEFNRTRLARGRELPALADVHVRFASPEDVILMKLKYFKEGQSEKHLRDIRGVLAVQGDKIDRAYIEDWAIRLDVVDEWRIARNDKTV